MEKKYFGIIIILAGVLVLLICVFLFFKYGLALPNMSGLIDKVVPAKETVTQVVAPTATKKVISGEENIETASVQNVVPPRQVGKDDLIRVAAAFAERFGSYSNQSNFSNIADLKLFMSENMKKWADDYVAAQKAKNSATDIYYGITTKSVAQELLSYDDDAGRAEIIVKTRRREAITSTNNTTNVFDQDVTLVFIKDQGAWRVDSAIWQSK